MPVIFYVVVIQSLFLVGALYGVYSGQEDLVYLLSGFWENDYWPTVYVLLLLLMCFIGKASDAETSLRFKACIALPILQLSARLWIAEAGPKQTIDLTNRNDDLNLEFPASRLFIILLALGLFMFPYVFVRIRHKILAAFEPAVLSAHCLEVLPVSVMATAPPLIYLTFKASTCSVIHDLKNKGDIYVGDEDCLGVVYSTRPLVRRGEERNTRAGSQERSDEAAACTTATRSARRQHRSNDINTSFLATRFARRRSC